VLAEPPRVKRRKPLTANVGVVSVGLDTYWKQCPGLYDDMLKKANVFEKRVESHDVNVTSFGISDNP
jgi:L-arabinose isomerase